MADDTEDVTAKAMEAEGKLSLIKESLKHLDTKGLKTLILEQKLSDQTIFMEVATELSHSLTQENFEKYTGFFEVCERCLMYLVRVGNPKELLLALLEQVDTFNDDTKWKTLLSGIQAVLLKLPNKRYHSLDITLSSVHAHIKSLPLPEDHDLDGEESKLLEIDPNVERISDVLIAYFDFLRPFVWEVSLENPDSDRSKGAFQIKMLTKDLLEMLNHPLVFLDVTHNEKGEEKAFKGNGRRCAEKLIELLAQLCANFMKTIVQSLEEKTRAEMKEKKGKTKGSKGSKDKTPEERKKDEEADVVDKWSECKTDEVVSMPSLSCLLHLILVEGLGLDGFPSVYTHQYMLSFTLPFVQVFLQHTVSMFISKGVFLLAKLVYRIPPSSLSVDDLDNPAYNKTLSLLMNVMTHCPVKEVRLECVNVFAAYIAMFEPRARVKVYEMIFSLCKHSGLVGHTIQLIKNEVDAILKADQPESVFLGENLQRLLKFVARLDDGAEADLLESSDQVISVLNLIRYLTIRDPYQTNKTGFWTIYSGLEKDFFEPLRLAIDFSKSHYKLELDNFKKGKSTVEKNVEYGINVSVAGMPMPKVPRNQQIQIVETALNTFDMISSLLSRIVELADVQLKAAKSESA